jgi:hypothetical protein
MPWQDGKPQTRLESPMMYRRVCGRRYRNSHSSAILSSGPGLSIHSPAHIIFVHCGVQRKRDRIRGVKRYWEIIADNLSKAGWS